MTGKPHAKNVRTLTAIAWMICAIAAALLARPYALSAVNAALMGAVRAGRQSEVERLLGLGADPNGYRAGRSAPLVMPLLSEAIQRGHVGVARALLAHGAKADPQVSGAPSALALAAQYGSLEEARLLLDYGADVNAADLDGNTPLILAAADPDILELIAARGAKIDAANGYGQTALLRSAGRLNVRGVRFLVGRGADVNCKTIRGMTPLHRAIRNSPGAGFSAPPNVGFSSPPMMQSPSALTFSDQVVADTPEIRRRRFAAAVEITRLLLNAGAAVNTRSVDGNSPLMEAVGHPPEIAALLLERGADPNYTNARKQSTLTLAIQTHRADIAHLLRKYGAQQ